jgi:hypothetical protein
MTNRRVAPAGIVVVAAVALLYGCAAQTPSRASAPAPNVNLSGYPPAFQAGYVDGCASVRSAPKRDEDRFKSDAQYAQGWRDGNDICKSR